MPAQKSNSIIGERLSRIEAQMETNGEKIDRVEKAIYGNGKQGLITEFQLLRQSVEEHHSAVNELKNRNRNDWKWIITTTIAFAAVIVALLK